MPNTFGSKTIRLAEVGSTNDEARLLAEQGSDEGTVVVADYQRGGRGRHGRSWTAPRGQNLLFSVILRPKLPSDRLGLISMSAAVAVSEAAEDIAGMQSRIKWPNDVLLGGRKCAGILLEAAQSAASVAGPEYVILGIGVNVNQTDFAADIADRSTSLRLVTGQTISLDEVLSCILSNLEDAYRKLVDTAELIRARFEDRLIGVGERITISLVGSDRFVEGVLERVGPDGGLQLRTSSGLETYYAGDVTLAIAETGR